MSKSCHRHHSVFFLLPLLLVWQGYALATGSVASSIMSQAMLSMMDAMGKMAQDYSRNRDLSPSYYGQPSSGWQGMISPWNMYSLPGTGIPGQQQIQGLVGQAPAVAQQSFQGMTNSLQPIPNLSPQSSLDGIWQGQSGELVLVMYGHFRIYANADNYRDGRYEVLDDHIIMHDPQTGAKRAYEFALSEGRLVLRDREGDLLLFRQLPIPIPPYSLISGQQTSSPKQQIGADHD